MFRMFMVVINEEEITPVKANYLGIHCLHSLIAKIIKVPQFNKSKINAAKRQLT